MDPKQAIEDMLMDLQLFTQTGHRDHLTSSISTLFDLLEWVDRDGFVPDGTFEWEWVKSDNADN